MDFDSAYQLLCTATVLTARADFSGSRSYLLGSYAYYAMTSDVPEREMLDYFEATKS